jgi:hypothetical protein
MNKLLVVCVVIGGLVTGCSKQRVAECDAFVATIEKISKCEKLPAETRKQVAESGKTIKDALKAIDDVGGVGEAPKDLVDQLRDTCKTQNKTVIDDYTKLMPECMK